MRGGSINSATSYARFECQVGSKARLRELNLRFREVLGRFSDRLFSRLRELNFCFGEGLVTLRFLGVFGRFLRPRLRARLS